MLVNSISISINQSINQLINQSINLSMVFINDSYYNGWYDDYDAVVVKYNGPETFIVDNDVWVKIYVSNGLYSFVDDGVMMPIDDSYLGYEWLEVMTVYDPLKVAEERKIRMDKIFGL